MLNKKYKFLPIILAPWLIVSGYFLALGEAEEVQERLSEEVDVICAAQVQERAETILPDLMDAIDLYAKQNLPSSELSEYALAYYRGFELELNLAYSEASNLNMAKNFLSTTEELNYCIEVIEQYKDLAYAFIRESIFISGITKRNYLMNDALSAFNANLETMSDDFLNTFPRSFEKLNNALPCYPKQCL